MNAVVPAEKDRVRPSIDEKKQYSPDRKVPLSTVSLASCQYEALLMKMEDFTKKELTITNRTGHLFACHLP